jgi:hypothetical protein
LLIAGAGALAGAVLARALSARAQQKLSQADAQYQSTPKAGLSCGLCTAFRPPNACLTVAGEINRTGWCKLFDMVD